MIADALEFAQTVVNVLGAYLVVVVAIIAVVLFKFVRWAFRYAFELAPARQSQVPAGGKVFLFGLSVVVVLALMGWPLR